jgi:GT2 family glycosyltransferase
VKILVVVVRYKTPLSESPALLGLCSALSSQSDLAKNYTVMIWDNSPEEILNPQLPIPFLYEHSKINLGVSGAYNKASEYAAANAYPWMLLLDQDTKITPEFLSTMYRHSLNLLPKKEIAVIVPTVRCNDTAISPARRLFGRNRGYPAGECGIAPGEATSINSGCMMRIASLQTIGGFSADFWLDFSDEYVFHQFFVHGMKVWRAADVELGHELSIMDYDHLMTSGRCRNFAHAETAFNDIYHGRLENALLTLRIFVRAIKHWMKYRNSEFSQIAWTQFIYRLRVPRAERLARWHAESKKRATQQTCKVDEIGRTIS